MVYYRLTERRTMPRPARMLQPQAEKRLRAPRDRHGLTQQQKEALGAKFNGMCHICQVRPIHATDHDHTCCPGRHSCGECVRGILCNNCNTLLGMAGDDIVILMRAIDYLRGEI